MWIAHIIFAVYLFASVKADGHQGGGGYDVGGHEAGYGGGGAYDGGYVHDGGLPPTGLQLHHFVGMGGYDPFGQQVAPLHAYSGPSFDEGPIKAVAAPVKEHYSPQHDYHPNHYYPPPTPLYYKPKVILVKTEGGDKKGKGGGGIFNDIGKNFKKFTDDIGYFMSDYLNLNQYEEDFHTPVYGTPAVSYGKQKYAVLPPYYRPERPYVIEEPAYHVPEPEYHNPEPSYHAPEPSYFAPEPSYHAPEAHHSSGPAYEAQPIYVEHHEPYQEDSLGKKFSKGISKGLENAKKSFEKFEIKATKKIKELFLPEPEPIYFHPVPVPYHAPKAAYASPEPTYGAPKPAYGPPQLEYGEPSLQHAPAGVHHISQGTALGVAEGGYGKKH